MARRYPSPPDSLDPTDWRMYCDLLQDAGASRRLWSRSLRIAESLEREPRLVVLVRRSEWPGIAIQRHLHLPARGFTGVARSLCWMKEGWELSLYFQRVCKEWQLFEKTTPFATLSDGLRPYLQSHRVNPGPMIKAFFQAHSLRHQPINFSRISF